MKVQDFGKNFTRQEYFEVLRDINFVNRIRPVLIAKVISLSTGTNLTEMLDRFIEVGEVFIKASALDTKKLILALSNQDGSFNLDSFPEFINAMLIKSGHEPLFIYIGDVYNARDLFEDNKEFLQKVWDKLHAKALRRRKRRG